MRRRTLQGLAVVASFCLAACGGAPPGDRADGGAAAPRGEAAAHASPPTMPAPPPERIDLVQVFVLPGVRPWEVQDALARAREAGAEVVALRMFQLERDRPHAYLEWESAGRPPTGVWYPARGAPQLAPDLAEVFIQAAHAEGLEAWAWMTTLASRWLIEEDPDLAGWSYDPITDALERTRRLDPFHPEVRSRLEGLWSDLGRAGFDGVLFQDDLVMRHTEGYGPHSARAWLREKGEALDPSGFYLEPRRTESGRLRVRGYSDGYREWAAWRTRHLLDLAQGLAEAFREAAPGAPEVALNVYYDELWTREGALMWLARDLDASLERSFDRYVVMAYHRQIGAELGREGAGLREALATMASRLAERPIDPARFIVKLQSVDWRTGEQIPTAELVEAAAPWLEAGPFSLGLAPWSTETDASFDTLRAAAREGSTVGEETP